MSDYQVVNDLIKKADDLVSKNATSSDGAFIQWQTRTRRFIEKRFGSDSREIKAFEEILFEPLIDFSEIDSLGNYINACKNGIYTAKAMLEAYQEEIDEERMEVFNFHPVTDHVKALISHNLDNSDKNKKYQVFISSTYKDLIEERQCAIHCLLDNNCIPVGMEQFPASNMSQMEYIEKMLNDCDYYILILGGRYGSLDEDGMGYTEKEYDYAISKGIPVLTFVVENPEKLAQENCEQDNKELYKSFREKVSKNKMIKFYSNIGDLKSAIVTSINACKRDFPAKGWVRGDLCD